MQSATIKRNFGNVVRGGRGYSLEELKEAGLAVAAARKNHVPVDVLRRTKYAENVEQLKPVAQAAKETKKSKPAGEKPAKTTTATSTKKKAK